MITVTVKAGYIQGKVFFCQRIYGAGRKLSKIVAKHIQNFAAQNLTVNLMFIGRCIIVIVEE